MVSDIVGPGSFHRHIMTTGGTTATAARTAQLGKEFECPVMPAMVHTAETQSMAMMDLSDTSCMLQV